VYSLLLLSITLLGRLLWTLEFAPFGGDLWGGDRGRRAGAELIKELLSILRR
jgi:hypothetical protein